MQAFSFEAYTVRAGDYTNSGYDTLNLTVDGSTGQTTSSPGSGTGFLGFVSTAAVSSFVLAGSTPEDFIDIVDGTVARGTVSTRNPARRRCWGSGRSRQASR